jgi:hypothetical protein
LDQQEVVVEVHKVGILVITNFSILKWSLFIILYYNFLFCSAVNKDDLPKMTLLGAGKVFSS